LPSFAAVQAHRHGIGQGVFAAALIVVVVVVVVVVFMKRNRNSQVDSFAFLQ
jgi:hypothetical protein